MKQTLARPAQVIVDSTYFQQAHGKQPRGGGHWGFCLVHPSSADYLDHVLWVQGKTYSEAKRVAQAAAAGRAIVIYVCS